MMIAFTDELLVGNEQIDMEHKMLFDTINNAHEQIKTHHSPIESAMELVQQLENYAETHFAHEEAYMEKIKDPELPLQRREHRQFRMKISEYHDVNVENRKQAEMILEELLEYLAKWLYRHILSSDTLIGKVPVLSKEEEEAVFGFTSKYHSGIPFIDTEHKRLFELIRETKEALGSEASGSDVERFDKAMEVLDELGEYTRYHFTHEEAYMERIHYEGYEEQVKAHTAFIYKIEDVSHEIVYEDAEEYLKDLVEYLMFWLTNHIYKKDLLIPHVEAEVDK